MNIERSGVISQKWPITVTLTELPSASEQGDGEQARLMSAEATFANEPLDSVITAHTTRLTFLSHGEFAWYEVGCWAASRAPARAALAIVTRASNSRARSAAATSSSMSTGRITASSTSAWPRDGSATPTTQRAWTAGDPPIGEAGEERHAEHGSPAAGRVHPGGAIGTAGCYGPVDPGTRGQAWSFRTSAEVREVSVRGRAVSSPARTGRQGAALAEAAGAADASGRARRMRWGRPRPGPRTGTGTASARRAAGRRPAGAGSAGRTWR